MTDFDDFFENIAEIQYLDGPSARPSEKEQYQILNNIWNYIALEERLLENDLSEYENDEEDDW